VKIRIRPADKLFSLYVRNRDNWKCVRCKRDYRERTSGLSNSHFWGRGRENTRFDPDNCDALCFRCHQYWGGDGREDYIEFKKKQLGEEGYKKLKIRAFTYKKRDDKLILLWLKQYAQSPIDNRKIRK